MPQGTVRSAVRGASASVTVPHGIGLTLVRFVPRLRARLSRMFREVVTLT